MREYYDKAADRILDEIVTGGLVGAGIDGFGEPFCEIETAKIKSLIVDEFVKLESVKGRP